MKSKLWLILPIVLFSCQNTPQAEKKVAIFPKPMCEYFLDFEDLGNRLIDTLRMGDRLIDPLDDSLAFTAVKHGFVQQGKRIFKKASTLKRCQGKMVQVEYYQEFTHRIDLNSYVEFEKPYFATKGKVYFWDINSDRHLMIPISDADPVSFIPFKDICGGRDKEGIYYGCTNFGMFRLNIPADADIQFIPKEDNFWNTPSHFVKVNKTLYDILYDFDKGYYCESVEAGVLPTKP
ncbi:MAG: hypothetical protein AAFY71_02775 [Bacteroidota bacterium]